jgi:hypothetical protein
MSFKIVLFTTANFFSNGSEVWKITNDGDDDPADATLHHLRRKHK